MTFRDFLRDVRADFPNLTSANARPTSPVDEDYNCIAWAAEDIARWWWPDAMGQAFWPSDVQRAVTLDAFVQAYGLQGYVEEVDGTLEPDKQKVAIYTDTGGKPTHAARQLPDGWWASKLGPSFDIEHEFHALDGPTYGNVARILARPTR